MTKPRVFSGIQPTGDIHIGNYLGAVKKWVELCETHDCLYCIVDDHAITVDYDPKTLPQLTFDAALTAMACGLNADNCTLFVQSHVPEHTELTWLFNTVTPLGSLFRMTQFKEKSRNALAKALSSKGDVARSTLLHQLKNTGTDAQNLISDAQHLIDNLNPESNEDEDAKIAAQINDRLGNLMQLLQVGLGISSASTGLFGYPVLQAADILLYKAALVPVGEDQEQHLELAREIAERFNKKFGEVFPMVSRLPGDSARILGLDGKQKMSKSLGNHIGILDTPEIVTNKLKGAYTDPQRIRKSDPGDPAICNIFSLHKHFSSESERAEIDTACRNASIGCFECKKRLAAGIDNVLSPIREKASMLRQKPQLVLDTLEQGQKRCQDIAKATLGETKSIMGLGQTALKNLNK